MVCLGNICRSPIAEGLLRHKAAAHHLNWTIDSAGTESSQVGKAPHPFSQQICKSNGIDISAQRARQFTVADFAHYDKIYAMAEDVLDEIKHIAGKHFDAEKAILFLDERYPGKKESVPDPYYGNEHGYKTVYAMIDETCDKIIEKYSPAAANN